MAKKPIFNEGQFAPTQWATAKDKADFANKFAAFVESNFDRSKFTREFYQRLSNCRGHIAHYNMGGFFATWFSTPAQKVEFVTRWLEQPIYGDPAWTFCDVERAIQAWLVKGKAWARQVERSKNETDELNKAADGENERKAVLGSSQDFKVFRRSENANSFGLRQFYVAARDGSCHIIHHSEYGGERQFQIGDILTCQLDQRKNPIFTNCECCERTSKDLPLELVKEVWESRG